MFILCDLDRQSNNHGYNNGEVSDGKTESIQDMGPLSCLKRCKNKNMRSQVKEVSTIL